jgi:hypothetical protein
MRFRPFNQIPFRQIHLDFHTGPSIPDVGRDFDADEFARQLVEANVDSVTLFAKCHHGHLYYQTDRPERHPSLTIDLLGKQIEACRSAGIATPIYVSVQCDEYAANHYPEWRVVNPGGQLAGDPLKAGWHIVDMSSGYQDFLADQLTEIVNRFAPMDGVFFDMCWDQPSLSQSFIRLMLKKNRNPDDAVDRRKTARELSNQYMDRFNQIVGSKHRKGLPRVWYNSRPKVRLAEEARWVSHVEIEALPTGGWGYSYFPLNVRWSRNFGLPYIGMTARFHKGWSDFGGIKPHAALLYECSQMLAHGAGCSVGDQMHPRGGLDREAYELIGNVYRHVRECEPYCVDAKPMTEVAVLRDVEGDYHLSSGSTYDGVVKLLQECHLQFDILPISTDAWTRFPAVIIPEAVEIDDRLLGRIERYVERGGRVLISGAAVSLSNSKALLKHAGVKKIEPPAYQQGFVELDRAVSPARTHHVLYEPTTRISVTQADVSAATIVDPYFDRTWQHFSGHMQTPPAKRTTFAAATRTEHVMLCGFPIFQSYATHGNLWIRTLASELFARLVPKPLIRFEGPHHVEITLNRQRKRQVLHVLSFAPQRRTPTLDLVEAPTPLVDTTIHVRTDKPPTRAVLAATGESLAFKVRDGVCSIGFSSTRGHDMIVLT